MRREIRICGFGGQGIILAGVILGETAAKAGFFAVQTQSYGPESRGGAARAEVVIAKEPVDYPRVTRADVVVALSQPAYDRYTADLAEGGVVLYDSGIVQADGPFGFPFTKTAEEAGHRIVANIVMLGCLGEHLGLFPADMLTEIVLLNVPAGTEDLNRRAAAAGRELYRGAVR